MRRYILAVAVILVVFLSAYFLWKKSSISGSGSTQASEGFQAPNFELVEKIGGSLLLRESLGSVPLRDENPSQKGHSGAASVVIWADLTHPDLVHALNLKRVMEMRFGDQVSWFFKHLPQDQACNSTTRVTRNPNACDLAATAQCTGEKFWAFLDLLTKNPTQTDEESRQWMLEILGLDVDAVDACVGSEASAQIAQDIEDAQSFGIAVQSKILVGGVPLSLGTHAPSLDALIRGELDEGIVSSDGRLPLRRFFPAPKSGLTGTQDMVQVDDFYMDRVEVMLAKDGSARPVAGMVPSNRSWRDAAAACHASGKRMCTEAEFRRACSGSPVGDAEVPIFTGRPWPYAGLWVPNICWDAGSLERVGGYETGQKAHCRSPEGVYDLTGNHWEWVGASEEEAVLVGGSYLDGESATCGARLLEFGLDYAAPWVGFRCCADQAVEPTGAGVVLDRKAKSFVVPDTMAGQTSVVHVVSEDCGPCVRPTAMLKDLVAEESGWSLLLVVVGADQTAESSFHSEGLQGLELWPDPEGKAAGELQVLHFPTTVVFDAAGEVLSRMDGFSAKGWSEIRSALR